MRNVKNKSRTYLLPLIASRCDIDMVKTANTYLYHHEDFSEYKLYVVHKFEPTYNIEDYDNRLSKSSLFVGREAIVGEPNMYLYHFTFSKDHRKAYHHFINGKYSQYCNIDKKTISDFWYDIYRNGGRSFLIAIKQVFDKDVKLRAKLEEELKVKLPENAELSSIINIEDEIYYYGD